MAPLPQWGGPPSSPPRLSPGIHNSELAVATGNAVGRDGVGRPGKAFSSAFRAPQSIRPAQDAAVRLDGGQADELGILPQGCYDVAIGPEQAQDGLLCLTALHPVAMAHGLKLNDVGPLRRVGRAVPDHGPQDDAVVPLRVDDQHLHTTKVEVADEAPVADDRRLNGAHINVHAIFLQEPPAVPLERGMYLAHAGHVTKVEQGPRQSAGLLGVHLLQGPPIRLLGEGVHRSHLLLSAHRGLN